MENKQVNKASNNITNVRILMLYA